MNRINPHKLLKTKWTAALPQNKEKHFMVTKLIREDGQVVSCILEAVHSRREQTLAWSQLKDETLWRMGWH